MSQLPGRGWVEYEPYGTVLIIGAWNFPFALTLGPAVGAIAAGNAVVLKPSEVAPASSALMAELVPRYLDNDAIAVVEGDGAVSQELIAQGFDRADVHRRHRDRPQGLRGRGVAPDPGHTRTRRQEPGDRGGRRRHRGRRQADRVDQADQLRPDLHRARLRAGRRDDPRRTRRQDRRRPSPSSRRKTPAASASSTSATSTGSPPHSPRPRARWPSAAGRMPSSLEIEPTVVVDPAVDEPLMTDEIFGPILPVVTVQIPGRGNRFRQLTAQAAGGLPVHQGQGASRERVIKEVPAGGMLVNHLLFQFDGQAAVRRGRRVGHGCLPRQVRLRGVQPPQVGADQADPTRLSGDDLPAVYREGVEAGSQAVLSLSARRAVDH